MERAFVTVTERGVVTLPAWLRRRLELDAPGTQLELVLRDDGVLELRPHVAVPAEQAWFWTAEWQQREREADEDVAHGRVTRHHDADALMAHLDALGDE